MHGKVVAWFLHKQKLHWRGRGEIHAARAEFHAYEPLPKGPSHQSQAQCRQGEDFQGHLSPPKILLFQAYRTAVLFWVCRACNRELQTVRTALSALYQHNTIWSTASRTSYVVPQVLSGFRQSLWPCIQWEEMGVFSQPITGAKLKQLASKICPKPVFFSIR